MKGEQYLRDLMAGKGGKLRDRLAFGCLKEAGSLYSLALRLRAAGYRFGILPSHRLPVPVISVGNITVGGTGKTPTVAWIADYLMRRGKRVAVLSRGYGGSAEGQVRIVSDGSRLLLSAEEAGDEPCLLARKLPGLMVVIGSDRYKAGLLAMQELKPDVFILDDGYQHLRLKRDLNILLLDASRPFSNGHTLPAGFLREGIGSTGRADLVVYTRCREQEKPDLVRYKPSLCTSHTLTSLAPIEGGERISFDAVKGARITAFSGIADPAAFFDMLEASGLQLTATLAFPDHTRYDEEEIAAICRLRDASRSPVLITTEKDAVKLDPHLARLPRCYAAALELKFADETPLARALEKLL